ncbi:MAG: DMT family transporter [Alphaproteobacteria bacterium]|nr:DMT family transporter [Alphaproteobacteria bacterium]
MKSDRLTRPVALLLFATVVLAWGFTWPVTKVLVQSITPLWTVALRSLISGVVLLGLLLAQGKLIVPRRGDLPVVFGIALPHMVAFSALVALGIQFVPAGRAIVLGYTTPLWVIPAARLILGEPITRRHLAGGALAFAGLMLMFNPASFDWNDHRALLGNGLLLLAAACWAVSIVHVRAHKWISTPFELVFWETLLATVLLVLVALFFEGVPRIEWTLPLILLLLYGGVCGNALAYWAMAMVNRSLPAATTSLGLLATPVVGTLSAALALGESISLLLLVAMTLILGGIALGTITRGRR